MLSCCFLDFFMSVGAFVIGPMQISSFSPFDYLSIMLTLRILFDNFLSSTSIKFILWNLI